MGQLAGQADLALPVDQDECPRNCVGQRLQVEPALLVGLWGCGSKAVAKATGGIPPGKGLFHSHEFRSTLKALPLGSKGRRYAVRICSIR